MTFISKEEIYEMSCNNDLDLMKKYCDQEKTYLFLHFMYAKTLFKNGKLIDAKSELKQLLSTKYEYSARFELGKIALSCQNYELAREHFYYVENYTDHQNARENARLEIAKLELECRRLKDSKIYFEKLLDTKYDETAKLNLGRICYQQEEYEEAKKYLKDLLDTSYDYVARFELAKTENALGNVDVARYYFQTSIEKGNKPAFYELGKLEYNEGNYREALELFKKCKYAGIYLPKTQYLLGKKEESINGFKSLFNTKDDYVSRIVLSVIYIKEQKYEEAFDTINSVIDYDKTDSDVRMKISLALLKELGVSCYRNFPDIKYLSYSDKLWAEYDETEVISHITLNHINNELKSSFSENIDLFNMLNYVKDNLTEENKTPTLNFNDLYHIDYSNVGNKGENLLRIATLPGTKEIITMFPVFTKRDDMNEVEDESIDYNTKVDMLLRKISNLHKLAETNDFEYADTLSDSEKVLLSEIFAIQNIKTKKITK